MCNCKLMGVFFISSRLYGVRRALDSDVLTESPSVILYVFCVCGCLSRRKYRTIYRTVYKTIDRCVWRHWWRHRLQLNDVIDHVIAVCRVQPIAGTSNELLNTAIQVVLAFDRSSAIGLLRCNVWRIKIGWVVRCDSTGRFINTIASDT